MEFWKAGEAGTTWEMRWQESSSLQMDAAEPQKPHQFCEAFRLDVAWSVTAPKKFLTSSDHSNVSNREGFLLENCREGGERRMCILDHSVGKGGWSACAASPAADAPPGLGWHFWLLHDTGGNRPFSAQLFVSPLPLPPPPWQNSL